VAWLIGFLRALLRMQKRQLRSFFSITLNNFFLFAAAILWGGVSSLLMAGKDAFSSSAPFLLALVLIMMCPLSTDPLSRVPASRLKVWPLDRGQKLRLRLATFVLTPAFWLAIVILIAKWGVLSAFLFFVFGIAVQAVSVLGAYLFGLVPTFRFPQYMSRLPGRLGGIIGLTIRQITSTLDFYVSSLLSLGGWIFRWRSSQMDPDAMAILSMLVALALSTYAQAAFGVDSTSVLHRYRVFPLRGWQIVLAKDLGYLVVLALLVLPFDISAGLTFGMVAIVLGRYPSLRLVQKQQRWRFTSGDIRFGICQIFAGFSLGLATARVSPWFLLGTGCLYIASVFGGGWLWDTLGVRRRQALRA
jgi:hypothetical protein